MLLTDFIHAQDEPTNHLDVAAVAWLTEYLQQLDTTVILVSHDYDFLSDVATDIIFFNNGTLGYYRQAPLQTRAVLANGLPN